MFITFEGIEGCGKSTQIRLLTERLQQSGYRVKATREPGGTWLADKIRALLLDSANNGMVPMAELMLYGASRAQHLSELVSPALKNGETVLCDRFSDSTRAYQCFGRGIERTVIEEINRLACCNLTPDLTILLDCPVELGLSRAKARNASDTGPNEERFEMESLRFHQRVRDGFLQLSMEEPERFIVIDAAGLPEDISAEIANRVVERLGRG